MSEHVSPPVHWVQFRELNFEYRLHLHIIVRLKIETWWGEHDTARVWHQWGDTFTRTLKNSLLIQILQPTSVEGYCCSATHYQLRNLHFGIGVFFHVIEQASVMAHTTAWLTKDWWSALFSLVAWWSYTRWKRQIPNYSKEAISKLNCKKLGQNRLNASII